MNVPESLSEILALPRFDLSQRLGSPLNGLWFLTDGSRICLIGLTHGKVKTGEWIGSSSKARHILHGCKRLGTYEKLHYRFLPCQDKTEAKRLRVYLRNHLSKGLHEKVSERTPNGWG